MFVPHTVEELRAQFPALKSGRIFFDGPGGTQVPQQVIDRMQEYFIHRNANHGGAFSTSRLSDDLIQETREALAIFLNASRPEEIVFGANMTSLTLSLSRTIARTLRPGDEILVSRLDHDANISPWLHIAQERECKVRWLDLDIEDCTLRMDQLDSLLNDRTRLVAVSYASNAVGTINPVGEIIEQAHNVGALCYIDAVHYAPHGPIDVQSLDCDFLVVSAYKFFGPHVGILYGKYGLLEGLEPYKVRPAPQIPPGKFETGTSNFEGIAGVLGALEYLVQTKDVFNTQDKKPNPENKAREEWNPRHAMKAIQEYEKTLTKNLLQKLEATPGLRIWGLTEPDTIDQRVPTVSFTLDGFHPRQIAEKLGREGIQVWDGNYYALAVTERLGLEDTGGMVRVGLVHYNTLEEIERLGEALKTLG
ncbi:MAG: cysteine desulfurase-like protein [Chloroflexi bacterium RBG_16_48_8]|nr:MAG: cysteine desulfurase-like protein [Chloroflexi bacterium RBG_16_48_8]